VASTNEVAVDSIVASMLAYSEEKEGADVPKNKRVAAPDSTAANSVVYELLAYSDEPESV
jgi:hypothetical protein